MTLVEFLLAQLAEDERIAESTASAVAADWAVSGYGSGITQGEKGWSVIYDEGPPQDSAVEHIARWDPSRVLAECAAKRRIIEAVQEQITGDDPYVYLVAGDVPLVLALLALPYADHPDFQEDWRV